MLTFKKFFGINNVLPGERLMPGRDGAPLAAATNVDVGVDGELHRRSGYSKIDAAIYENIWQADGFMLATTTVGDLIARAPNGTTTTIYFALGCTPRVWYCNLPDGRTTFSNGLINGITDGATLTAWGVPIPLTIGALASIPGDLAPGDYQYQITYVRLSDGQEGGPEYSNPLPVPDGGISLTGLPTLIGHKINVYLSGQHGEGSFYAGSTTGSTFTFTGANSALIMPNRTEFLDKPPVGTITALWRSRVLIAKGDVLCATKVNQHELFDPARDFKQFTSNITLIQPVDEGVFVGTETELAYLSGTEFDKLVYKQVVNGRTVLGSGVSVRGELIKQGDGASIGAAMVCIADGVVVAGFSSGAVLRMTEGRYRTAATEVAATFRITNGIPQYIAIPQ
jgi:hypothetical protein